MHETFLYNPLPSPETTCRAPDLFSPLDVKKNSQETLLQLQFDSTITRLSRELRAAYNGKDIDLDMNAFEKKMKEKMLLIRNSNKIPELAKKKFLEDILSRSGPLSEISEQHILNLKSSQRMDSF